MKYVYRHDLPRFAQWANRVWGVEADFNHPEAMALEGIRRLEEFYKRCGLPIRLGEFGIDDSRFEEMASKASGGGAHTIGSFVKLDKSAIVAILKLSV